MNEKYQALVKERLEKILKHENKIAKILDNHIPYIFWLHYTAKKNNHHQIVQEKRLLITGHPKIKDEM